MTGIFINYRTGDASFAARFVADELTNVFGPDKVFLDHYSLRPGVDFPPELWQRLSTSTVLLALIGPQWLTMTDATGEQLANRPQDYVRREIEYAFERGIEVWPVLLNDVQIDRTLLPQSICALADRQYLQLRARGADYDVARLVTELREKVPATHLPRAVGTAPATVIQQHVGTGAAAQGTNSRASYVGTAHYHGAHTATPATDPDPSGPGREA